jgi:hypothetical protein
MDTICPPAINIYEDNIIFEDKRDSIKLNWIAIIHPQLDSMLMKITNGLKKDSNLCFYITFMRYGGKFYIEIFEDYPNNYLFDIKNKKDFLSQRLARKIYGYVKCNDIDIYLLLFPAPYEPDKETLDNLMEAKDMIVIYRNDEKYHFVQENPMWLYEYFDGNINLIKSVNDKGFFTSP